MMWIVDAKEVHREGCPVRYAAIINGETLNTPSGEPYRYTTEKLAMKAAVRAISMGWTPANENAKGEKA